MTRTQIRRFSDNISTLSGAELIALRELLNDRIDEVASDDENFMLHDYLDEYFYYVYYLDGSRYLFTKGKDAYDEYMRRSDAVRIVSKTKDLFPTFKELIRKEIA